MGSPSPRDVRTGHRARPSREGARREWLHGVNAVAEALAAQRRNLVTLRIRRGGRRAELAELARRAEALGLRVEEVEAGDLGALVPPGVNPQGVALEAGPLPEPGLEELLRAAREPATLVALDGVEDPQNVGSIARVAEAAGAAGLVLTRRRAPPLSPALVRASAGAVEWLPVARVPNLSRALVQLKERGFWVFGGSPQGGDDLFALPDSALAGPQVLVLGAEGRGLRPGVERQLDYRVRIPTVGRVSSLNVATAAAVLLFALRRPALVATSR